MAILRYICTIAIRLGEYYLLLIYCRVYFYTVSQKITQLWNGIARNYKDRFWWYLAEIFKRLQNRVRVFPFHVGYRVIISQTAYRKWRVHAVCFSQLLSAHFLAALETHIFVNNLRNWRSMDPLPHVKFLWLFSGSDVCLPDTATATQLSTFSSVWALCLPLPGRLSTVPNFTSSLLMLFFV